MARLEKVRKVLLYTLFLNIMVAVAKIIYGNATNSISMLSDGFHSLSDGASNIIGLVGIWIASQPPDENHPYGHRKFETLSTIVIAVFILFAGYEIFRKAYLGLQMTHRVEVTSLSFAIMIITLLINAMVMTYEKRKGHELKSDFLVADALHTYSDIFVSLSVIISLLAAKVGYPVVDIIAAIIIAFLIAKMGLEIFKSAADVLADAVRISPKEVKAVVKQIEGVKDCHGIRTRGRKDAVYVDLHVLVGHEVNTMKAHDVAHSVEDALKEKFPSVVDVVVHIEPYSDEEIKG